MKLYIGKLSEVLCESILAEIKQHTVEPSNGHMVLEKTNPFYNDYLKQTQELTLAGYADSVVEYRHYQSGIHFDKKYVEAIETIINATPIMYWVSEIRPGKCIPMHWDINPWEEEHRKLGKLVRYFCFLSKPEFGHIFVTDTDAYYNELQGSIYQYPDLKMWHAGSNVGLTNKYLLTITAYQKI